MRYFQVLILTALVAATGAASDSDMRQLLDHILNSTAYSSRVRPIKDTGNILSVNVDMFLVSLNDVDEVEQKIQTTAYLKVMWSDYFLSWTPASFANIQKITVKQDRIWKPDLALANAYDTISGLGDSFMYLTITYQGEVTWYPYQVFDSTCSLNMTYFPFDSQACDIQLVTWSSTKEMINIVSGTDGLDTTYYESNANWDLLSASTSDASTSTTAGIAFTLNIKRKPFFFLLNFIIPIVCLSILNLFVFVLPCESGEKTNYAIVLFLSFAIFLLIVTEIMPEGMKTVPVMSTYLLIECVMSTIIVFVTIIQLRLHNQDSDTPVPHFLKSFVGIVFAVKRKLCLDKNYEDEARKREEELEKETSFYKVGANRGEKISEALPHSVTDMPAKSGYFRRKKRVMPDGDLNSGSSSSNSYPTDDIELMDAETPRIDEKPILNKPRRKFIYTDHHVMTKKPKAISTAAANVDEYQKNMAGNGIKETRQPRIRLNQIGATSLNGNIVSDRPLYQYDPDLTQVKHIHAEEDDIYSIDTLEDEVTWADVATAMDALFFVIFFVCNIVTTLAAFLLSALGGN